MVPVRFHLVPDLVPSVPVSLPVVASKQRRHDPYSTTVCDLPPSPSQSSLDQTESVHGFLPLNESGPPLYRLTPPPFPWLRPLIDWFLLSQNMWPHTEKVIGVSVRIRVFAIGRNDRNRPWLSSKRNNKDDSSSWFPSRLEYLNSPIYPFYRSISLPKCLSLPHSAF